MGSLFKKKPTSPPGVLILGPKASAELCRVGEACDFHLAKDRSTAMKGYESILQRMIDQKCIDTYILGKLTLGIFLANVIGNDQPQAFALWNNQLPGKRGELLGFGISLIEKGVLGE